MLPRPLETVAQVCRRLHAEPYLVGGSVRDPLLGRVCQDWDMVTRKARQAATLVARKLPARLVILDEQHRIYRVVAGESKLDIAEIQGATILEDLARRDFTVNAMARRLGSNRLIDPFNGQKDIRRKILRAVSRQAFAEDPLRLLRAYRLAAQFALTIEPATRRWIQEASPGFRIQSRKSKMRAVSAERVREEFLRLLCQTEAFPALGAMDRSGLLTSIFPDLEAGRRVARAYYGTGGVLKHALESVAALEWILERIETRRALGFIPNQGVLGRIANYCREPIGGVPRSAFLKLGALLHDVGKPATAQMIRGRLRFFGHDAVGADRVREALETLRFSRREVQGIRAWVGNHMRPGNLACVPVLSNKAISKFYRDLGEEGVGMLLIALGDHYTYLRRSQWGRGKDPLEKTVSRMLAAYYLQPDAVLPPRIVNGHLLMKRLRLKPGPIVGKLLEEVRDGQVAGRVKTPEQAVALAKARLQSLAKRSPS